jgi:hypothetical protein
MQLVVEGRDAMNSKELNVNVPLATVESDSEEFEVKILKVFFHEKGCFGQSIDFPLKCSCSAHQ